MPELHRMMIDAFAFGSSNLRVCDILNDWVKQSLKRNTVRPCFSFPIPLRFIISDFFSISNKMKGNFTKSRVKRLKNESNIANQHCSSLGNKREKVVEHTLKPSRKKKNKNFVSFWKNSAHFRYSV